MNSRLNGHKPDDDLREASLSGSGSESEGDEPSGEYNSEIEEAPGLDANGDLGNGYDSEDENYSRLRSGSEAEGPSEHESDANDRPENGYSSEGESNSRSRSGSESHGREDEYSSEAESEHGSEDELKKQMNMQVIQKTNRVGKFDLYKRNLRGVVGATWTGDTTSMGGLAKVILSPFTLFIGAGVKTAIDIASRTPLPDETQVQICTRLNVANFRNEDGFDELIDDILKYKPDSNSSQQLIQNLLAAKKQELKKVKHQTKDARIRLIIEERDNFISSLNSHEQQWIKEVGQQDVDLYKLTEINEARFNMREIEIEMICADQRRDQQRDFLAKFMEMRSNVGKKMTHVVAAAIEKMDEAKKAKMLANGEFSGSDYSSEEYSGSPRSRPGSPRG